MGDHFEHVGYRYRRDSEHLWHYTGKMSREITDLADRGWQVERLYRRCEDE